MKLRESIGDVPNLVFTYDHHRSIKKGVNKVFLYAGYNIYMHNLFKKKYMHHLKQNVNSHFNEVDMFYPIYEFHSQH